MVFIELGKVKELVKGEAGIISSILDLLPVRLQGKGWILQKLLPLSIWSYLGGREF